MASLALLSAYAVVDLWVLQRGYTDSHRLAPLQEPEGCLLWPLEPPVQERPLTLQLCQVWTQHSSPCSP